MCTWLFDHAIKPETLFHLHISWSAKSFDMDVIDGHLNAIGIATLITRWVHHMEIHNRLYHTKLICIYDFTVEIMRRLLLTDRVQVSIAEK